MLVGTTLNCKTHLSMKKAVPEEAPKNFLLNLRNGRMLRGFRMRTDMENVYRAGLNASHIVHDQYCSTQLKTILMSKDTSFFFGMPEMMPECISGM